MWCLSRFQVLRPRFVATQVYPIGIPLLYAFILWVNRGSLNPRVQAEVCAEADGGKNDIFLKKEEGDLQERLERRRQNPDLVPSMFLWKDFGTLHVSR